MEWYVAWLGIASLQFEAGSQETMKWNLKQRVPKVASQARLKE
jgi:hypothetical protein